jgi:hypothetical protein
MESNCVLDRAIEFFLTRPGITTNLENLTERSKIAVLRQLTNKAEMPKSVRERIFDDLAKFDQVREITEPILERYTIEPKEVWLRELVDAYDLTVFAWGSLDESFRCEFRTYRENKENYYIVWTKQRLYSTRCAPAGEHREVVFSPQGCS